MSHEMLAQLFSSAVYLVVLMVCVLIVPGMLIGLVIAVIQSATQVNEQTLSFLPKLVITLLMLVFAGPWLLSRITDTFHQLFFDIPYLIG